MLTRFVLSVVPEANETLVKSLCIRAEELFLHSLKTILSSIQLQYQLTLTTRCH